MIINLSSNRIIFSCLLALFPYFVFSTQIILTPDNLQEVLTELSNRHEEEISIPMTEVQLFLKQNISGDFAENLLPPEPEITEMDNEQIAFAWTEVASANAYTTRYLNLDNGDFNDLTTENPAAHFSLENHLFLFTFQAISAEGKGRSVIIIQDKPLTIGNSILSNNCECEIPLLTELYDVLDMPQRLVQYPLGEFNDTYSIHLTFTGVNGNTVDASFAIRLKRDNQGIFYVFLTRGGICSSNIKTEYGYVYVVDPGANKGDTSDDTDAIQFSFGGPGMGFKSLSPDFVGTLTLTKCDVEPIDIGGGISDNPGKWSGKIAPNPSSGITSLYLDQWTNDQQSRLLLKNTTGEMLKDFRPTNEPRQLIDLSTYPNGTYYLQVVSGKQSEVYPIVKIE